MTGLIRDIAALRIAPCSKAAWRLMIFGIATSVVGSAVEDESLIATHFKYHILRLDLCLELRSELHRHEVFV